MGRLETDKESEVLRKELSEHKASFPHVLKREDRRLASYSI
jgi:hypothetical protein